MSPLLPGPLVFPLSLLPVSPSSSSHTISHTHASLVVLGLGLGRDADRRKKTGSRRRIVIKEHLVAEDRKRIFGGSASSWKGPESPSHTSHKHCHNTLSLSHHLPVTFSVTLCHLARVVMPTEERRLVAEEGSLSKNTWSQKIARGLSRCRWAPVEGLAREVPPLPGLSPRGVPGKGGKDDFWRNKIARGDARWMLIIMVGSTFADNNFYKGFLSRRSGHQGRVVFLRVLRFPPTKRPSELFIFKIYFDLKNNFYF